MKDTRNRRHRGGPWLPQYRACNQLVDDELTGCDHCADHETRITHITDLVELLLDRVGDHDAQLAELRRQGTAS